MFLTKHDRTGSYPSYLSAQSEFLASTTSTPGHHEVQPVPTRAPFVYTQLLCWLKWVCCLHGLASMPSAQEIAKRALVQLVRTQGSQYGVDVAVTRESPPGDVTRAYRALARKVHPDKPGGSKEDFQKLSASYNAWADLMKATGAVGRPAQPRAGEIQVAAKGAVIPRDPLGEAARSAYRVRAQAVLLTYQGVDASTPTLRD